MELTQVLEEVKAELKASIEKAQASFESMVKVTSDLEARKFSLQSEVAALEVAIEPKRKEAEGQHKHVQEAMEAVRKARSEQDAAEAALKADLKKFDEQRAAAKKAAEVEFEQRFKDLKEQEAAIEKRIAEKQAKLEAFQAEWSK